MNFKPTKEQERIFNFIKNRPENVLIKAFAGCGKCLGINTPILMYDGNIKMVQDIKIGDLLMGDDSKPRKVLNTNIGYGKLFKIIPVKGDSWICNDVHVMSIHHETMKKIIDIPLNEINYPKYSNGNYRYSRLVRTGVEFQNNDTNIDPYLLGLWLGDGTKEKGNPPISVHVSEIPILDYLSNIKYLNITPKFKENQKNLFSVGLTTPNFNGRKVSNILRNEFKKCLDNYGFHIPKEYLINSKKNRLSLLAGIIDSDGYNHNGCYEIITKHKRFADDILFLTRSLGFASYCSNKTGSIKRLNFIGKYYRIMISGSFEEVSCLLGRKKCESRKQNKSVLRTGFKKEEIEDDYYYGFTLDGNGRFLLGDFTITHNTTTIVEAVKLVPEDKQITFLAFNKHLQLELKEKLPPHVRCYTSYGLGNAAVKRKYGDKITFDEFKADKCIAKKAKSWDLDEEFKRKEDIDIYLNSIKKLVNLCRLSLTLKEEYIPYVAERHDINLQKKADIKRVLKVLDTMTNDRKTYDYTDMIFLPAIDNSIWMFPQDYVFVDEIQDFNRCQIRIVEKILKRDKISGNIIGRLISVGDNFQCQPIGSKILMSNGLEKNIEDLCVGNKVVSYDRHNKGFFVGYYKNHRWGSEAMKSHGYNVDDISKRKYCGNLISIKTDNNITKYTPNHKCLVRIDKNSEYKYILYLMERNGYYRIGICPIWSKDGINFNANRTKQENADNFWVLNVYKDRMDAYSDEQFYSTTYSIPQLIFYYRQQRGNINQEYIDKFYTRFDRVNLKNNAISLLKFHNKEIDYPFWSKGCGCYFSKEHMFEINACNIISDIMEMIIFSENNIKEIKDKGKFTNKIVAKYCKIDELNHEPYNDFVYSLKIEKHEVYVSDNVLTHNCIYGFNAADEKSFKWFEDFKNTKVLPLSYSFRCAKNIILKANEIVPDIKALEDAPDGIVRDGSVLDEADSGDFVLCRTTMPLVKLFFEFLLKHKKAIIKGSDIGVHLVELIGNIKDINLLITFWETELSKYRQDLRNKGVLNPLEHSGYVTLEDKVTTLLFIAKMSKDIETLKTKIGLIFTDEIQGIVLSTIHKAKGLESNRVFIIRPDLMPLPNSRSWQYAQELNLIYVAHTRAKTELIFDRVWTDEDGT